MNFFLSRLPARSFCVLFVIALPTWALAATEEFEIRYDARPGMIINLEHSFGNMDVRLGSDDKVKIVASKLAESGNPEIAQDFLDQIEFRVVNGTNQLDIATVYPNIGYSFFRRNKIVNRGMDYVIEIPSDTTLNVELRFGNIDMNGLSGDFEVKARQAVIQANGLVGDLDLSNVGGSIAVESIRGDIVIGSNQGAVSALDINGNLELINKFGSTDIKNIQGNVITKGEITPIKVEDIGGAVDIETYASVITVTDVAGDVRVQAREAEVNVINTQADVIVKNRQGEISVERINGDIDIVSGIGPVTIRHANQNITVTGNSADLVLENIFLIPSELPRKLDLTTSLGFIKLDLPAELSATLRASTTRRPINANFPVFLHESTNTQLEISAEFGDQKDSITLTGTENVEMTLRKL